MVATAIELNAAITEFTEHLQKGLRVEAVVLYGSYVNGQPHEWSDIDVAIISPDFEGVSMPKRQEMMAHLTFRAEPRISPLGYPSSEYRNPGAHSFLGEIIRTGKVVYPRGE